MKLSKRGILNTLKGFKIGKSGKVTFKSISDFSENVKQEFKTRNGLLRKLVLTITIILIFSLGLSAFATYEITKVKTESEFKASTIQILNQNKNYIDLIAQNVEDLSMQYLDKGIISLIDSVPADSYESMVASRNLRERINASMGQGTNSLIDSIDLIGFNGISAVSGAGNANDETFLAKLKGEAFYKQAVDNDGRSIWTYPHIDVYDSSNPLVISKVRMLKSNTSFKQVGILKINIKPDIFNAALVNTKIGKSGYIFIVNQDGTIISHKDPKLVGTKLKDSYFPSKVQGTEGNFEFKDGSQSMFGVYTSSEVTGWKFIAEVPKAEISSTANSIGIAALLALLFFIIISVLASIVITVQITAPIKDIIFTTNQLAEGDFTVSTASYKIHELNELSSNFNSMIGNLKQMLSSAGSLASETNKSSEQLLQISGDINETSKSIVTAVQEISSGSTKQAEESISCARISDTFNEEITRAINALTNVSTATKHTMEVINENSMTISNLSDTSRNNSKVMTEVADTITRLNGNTSKIQSILGNINNITKQTNLLSLNASIEAARAGDAGRGFSVVAHEIRKLAEQSQAASVMIGDILEEINQSIKSSLALSDEAQDAFKKELSQVNSTVKSFDLIKESIDNISSSMNATMSSIRIIDKDKQLLNESINNIAAISEENTAATEEVTASIQQESEGNNTIFVLSEGLNDKAEALKGIINKFKY